MTEHLSGDFYTQRFSPGPTEDTLILNLGPQHPSTHGVLRIIVELDGEYVLRAEPVLGYVHRMHEKMGEVKTWAQYYPNLGRVDYLHPLAWNWGYVGAVEKLAGLEVPERAEFIRVIVTELNRIKSHLLWWGAYLLDLGAVTPIMYAFMDIENLNDILQRPTGSRLTYCYFRFGGLSADLDDTTLGMIRDFVPHMRGRLPMYKDLVTDNVILRNRLENVGEFSLDLCQRYGVTGPCLRGSGKAYDVRRAEPYGVYDRLDFEIPTYPQTDCMGRYLVRMDEIEQSLRIIEQALKMMPAGDFIHPKAPKAKWTAPRGEVYYAVESARGKVGFWIVSDGKGRNPYRVKLRSPCFCNLSCFAEAAQGTLLADAVATLGSLDLVIPELDR
ncbi:NADH dehydrogenase subunit D [Desulfocurvibacter africanus PCS]|uniref:NADH-quinone oxidoreductase subunit D n=1 Tax=Desulfocurvibacter africanus PCS TaxID=1262666 RepID=M5PZN2_DESAF|nr:NADH-quinone oxidoreductase subunit D [Desulfocurvibacter africanus]EMG35991.1 NADH dehydrogenase subunit D [Desulfocurvibacter africanus PCS]